MEEKGTGTKSFSFERSAGSRSGGARTALIAQRGRSSPTTLFTPPPLALREKSRRREGEEREGGYCNMLSECTRGWLLALLSIAEYSHVNLQLLPTGPILHPQRPPDLSAQPNPSAHQPVFGLRPERPQRRGALPRTLRRRFGGIGRLGRRCMILEIGGVR